MILIYQRVSSEDQAKDGTTSLAEQERKNKAVATLRGADLQFDIISYTDRAVSGSVPLKERPEGARMLAEAKEGDCVIACKLDRLFRSAVDALVVAQELKQKKIDLILQDISTEPVTGSGVGKALFNMMATFAELERERIGERMKEGRAAKKSQGMRISGHAPYGYRFEGEKPHTRLVKNEDEIKVLREAALAWKQFSPVAATQQLNDLGFRDRNGSEFRITQVKRLVERAKELQ